MNSVTLNELAHAATPSIVSISSNPNINSIGQLAFLFCFFSPRNGISSSSILASLFLVVLACFIRNAEYTTNDNTNNPTLATISVVNDDPTIS